jgi:hypothetical protein
MAEFSNKTKPSPSDTVVHPNDDSYPRGTLRQQGSASTSADETRNLEQPVAPSLQDPICDHFKSTEELPVQESEYGGEPAALKATEASLRLLSESAAKATRLPDNESNINHDEMNAILPSSSPTNHLLLNTDGALIGELDEFHLSWFDGISLPRRLV